MSVRVVWHGTMSLGEGPIWDASRGVLWFVDIKRQNVHRYSPATNEVETWTAPQQVGWVVPAVGGRLISGLQSGLGRFDPDSGAFDEVVEIEPDLPDNRLNDATLAPDGAIWFGTMDDAEQSPSGRIYRWDGVRATQAAISPVCITNGPGLSPDGGTLYHVDTLGGVIHASALAADGSVCATREFARIDLVDGAPDGVTVDAKGNVWVGLWGGWRARLYSPGGTILTEVRFPTANVTKVSLGGPDLRTAYATTARIGLTTEELATQPNAGALFAFDVQVEGQRLPPARMQP